MPIATAPALLIGLGARLLLDHYSRSDGPYIKDFMLLGIWQGVALQYATKNSGSSGFGAIVAFGIATKLFIEFNIDSDVSKCLSTLLGVGLGVLFTDFLSQYFDKPSKSSSRKKPSTSSSSTPTPTPAHVPRAERKRDKPLSSRYSSTQAPTQTAETSYDFAPGTNPFSDITSVDSFSERVGPISSLSPLEREVHVLRTRAALADSERRRCKEERKWAISQGNLARASQMKWDVKRYTALMETFNREADEKAQLVATNSSQVPEARKSIRPPVDKLSSNAARPSQKPSASTAKRIATPSRPSNGRDTHG